MPTDNIQKPTSNARLAMLATHRPIIHPLGHHAASRHGRVCIKPGDSLRGHLKFPNLTPDIRNQSLIDIVSHADIVPDVFLFKVSCTVALQQPKELDEGLRKSAMALHGSPDRNADKEAGRIKMKGVSTYNRMLADIKDTREDEVALCGVMMSRSKVMHGLIHFGQDKNRWLERTSAASVALIWQKITIQTGPVTSVSRRMLHSGPRLYEPEYFL